MTVICIFMILFPAAFFVSDGYRGGMPVFFVFAVTISVFMLRGRLACIVTGLEPVSYTHLDVYKRQGYEPASVQLNLRKDSTVDVGLVSPLPVLRDSGFHFVDGEGAVLKAGEGTTAPRAEILYYLRFLFADPDAVEIDSVEAVLNGVVIGSALYREMWMGAAGLPLEPGTNLSLIHI